jgi:hypothetical protein
MEQLSGSPSKMSSSCWVDIALFISAAHAPNVNRAVVRARNRIKAFILKILIVIIHSG